MSKLVTGMTACVVLTLGTVAPALAQSNTGEVRHDFPYASRYVTVNGARMHYIEAGTGNPILFIHGNPTWSYLWRDVLPHVEGVGRVIAVDLIGFGKSDKPDIEYSLEDQVAYLRGFIDRLGLRELTLVVHDWGSYLGLQYAMSHPDDVKGIVFMEAILAAAPGEPQVPEEWRPRMRELGQVFAATGTEEQGRRLVIEENVFIERLLPLAVARGLSEDELEAYRAPFRRPEWRRPILALRRAAASPQRKRVTEAYTRWLTESPQPKLMIAFTPGVMGDAAQVAWVRDNVRDVTVVDGGVGIHIVQEDAPAVIGRAIAAWMRNEDLAESVRRPDASR